MWGDTVWQKQMEQVSKKGKQHVFSVTLTTHDHPEPFFLRVWWKKQRKGQNLGWTACSCLKCFFYGARSLLRWKVVFMFLYLPPGPGGTAMSEGRICPDRNWPLSNWCRVDKLIWLQIKPSVKQCDCVCKGVTRMAYSPRLWLMAIGWWYKINQCRKLKLNQTQTWGVCMSLDSGMHWSQNQWYCDDKPKKE